MGAELTLLKELYSNLSRIRGVKPHFVVVFLGDEPLAMCPTSMELDPRMSTLVYGCYMGLEAVIRDLFKDESEKMRLTELLVSIARGEEELYFCIYSHPTSFGIPVLLGVLVEGNLTPTAKLLIRSLVKSYLAKLINTVLPDLVEEVKVRG